jgi:uncharacterized protein
MTRATELRDDGARSDRRAAAVRGRAAVGAPVRRPRLVGVDIARALAFGGMLLSHYVAVVRPGEPGWLRTIADIPGGRAAPVFCLVLGIGAGLLVRGGVGDSTFFRRAVVMMALGLALWPQAGAVLLILPHYAVLLALTPLLRRLPRPALLSFAAVAFVAPSIVVAAIDGHRLRGSAGPASYHDLTDVGGFVGRLMWTGGYPLVGWIGFFAVGIWLAGLSLTTAPVRRWMIVVGIGIAALHPVASWALDAAGGDVEHGVGPFLDTKAHSNHAAWYVVATGTAVALVGLALVVDGRRRRGWARPLVSLGQLALSAYLAHLAIGRAWVWPWRDDDQPSLAAQMAVAGLVFAGLAAAATLWRILFRRGPAEVIVRVVAALGQRRRPAALVSREG